MASRPLTRLFPDLEDFEERHSEDDLEACAAALWLQHRNPDRYEECRDRLDARRGSSRP